MGITETLLSCAFFKVLEALYCLCIVQCTHVQIFLLASRWRHSRVRKFKPRIFCGQCYCYAEEHLQIVFVLRPVAKLGLGLNPRTVLWKGGLKNLGLSLVYSGAGTMGARVLPCPPLCESVGHGGHNRNIEKSRLICVDYVQIWYYVRINTLNLKNTQVWPWLEIDLGQVRIKCGSKDFDPIYLKVE